MVDSVEHEDEIFFDEGNLDLARCWYVFEMK